MKTPSQKQVWENIAQEWHKFKIFPGKGVEDFLKKQKGKILDLGSGAGRNLIKVRGTKMYLVDFSEKMLKLAEKKAKKQKIKIQTTQAELTKLPFEDNFFDAAITISSIHCIEGKSNREKAVKELFRVLKPGAEVKVAVWDKDSKRFKNAPKDKYVKWRDKGARYYYLFNEKELHDLFKKVGFKIKKKLDSYVMITFIVKKPKR
ncbi:MAG TPA: class I SAM-dependent methyltransferase [Candidatus Pacearchaeota archaeon]|nr:ubiquinone/menaquinone biosynthesis C-methyltransferase UbiE [archaeon BMS3Abin17]HDK42629.1 class I SAM-dependent methyltransferase [Candidatus Pacearchaeota archaeon]HDZ60505.1 class I SAM-dependent methyltransferase [Candidatus Pacearchaeota archaeon]